MNPENTKIKSNKKKKIGKSNKKNPQILDYNKRRENY